MELTPYVPYGYRKYTMTTKGQALSQPITSFSGEHFFLSNSFEHPFEHDGEIFLTIEHAYQAYKTDDPKQRRRVRNCVSPELARLIGKSVTLREGWDDQRFALMETLIRAKFADPTMAAKLKATGSRNLIDGRPRSNTVWGCARGKDGEWRGRNELGKILMRVRDELR
jgi:ribA/ribD-fused uncharacterized protein